MDFWERSKSKKTKKGGNSEPCVMSTVPIIDTLVEHVFPLRLLIMHAPEYLWVYFRF